MNATLLNANGTLQTLQLPEFDWNDPIDPDLQVTIAEVGDAEMRVLLAAHPSIVHRAARELLTVDDADVTATLKANPRASQAWFLIPKTKRKKIRSRAKRSSATVTAEVVAGE